MSNERRRRVVFAVLVILGTFFGATGTWILGRGILSRAAAIALTEYAADLTRYSERYAVEVSSVWDTFHSSAYAFCSPQEIAAMQEAIFQSLQIKDIGHSQNGMLYCSALAGRLATPVALPDTFLLLSNGARLYTDSPLAKTASRGKMIEMHGVDVFLSSLAYDYWERPHTHYAVFLTNAATGQMVQIAGSKLPVDNAHVLSPQEWRLSGTMYRSLCNTHDKVCVVTAEAERDILSGSQLLLSGFAGMGALAGLGLSLAVGQFYLRSKGLAQQLRRAIRKDAVALVYQPILELPSRCVTGAEALVRWSDENHVPIPPDHFVRIAEERGWIGELSAMVVRKTMRELGDMLRQYPNFTLSINIAASDLGSESLFAQLDEHVRKAGIAPAQIALELTERSTADLAVVRQAVLQLHEHGYKVHIDDFGTGFSSLVYLHELDIDAIKIDRVFTRTLGTDAVTASILPQILSMAESLDLSVIVEGVETETQANYLESTGKPIQAQGYFFAKPVAADLLHRYAEHICSDLPAGSTEVR